MVSENLELWFPLETRSYGFPWEPGVMVSYKNSKLSENPELKMFLAGGLMIMTWLYLDLWFKITFFSSNTSETEDIVKNIH